MRARGFVVAALLGMLALPVSATLGAAEIPVINTHCPVSGKPIDPNVKMLMMTVSSVIPESSRRSIIPPVAFNFMFMVSPLARCNACATFGSDARSQEQVWARSGRPNAVKK